MTHMAGGENYPFRPWTQGTGWETGQLELVAREEAVRGRRYARSQAVTAWQGLINDTVLRA